jgi:ubiquinone/menaquinone biosynthesis C-methylase UbiE
VLIGEAISKSDVRPGQTRRDIAGAGSLPFFDAINASWLPRYDADTPGGYALRVRKQRVIELLDKRGGNLLDVGCGAGVMAQDAVTRGFRFWGLDGSPKMIEVCRATFARRPETHFLVGSATSLEFPDDFFDVVLCMGVIDHVADYPVAVREMLRVLRPGGQAIISFPNRHNLYSVWRNSVFYPLLRMLRKPYYALKGKPAPPALTSRATLFSERQIVRLFRDLGSEVRDVVYFNFNICLSPLDEILPHTATRIAEKLESRRSGTWRRLGCGFLVSARKAESAGLGQQGRTPR